jgi:hypothetical protein
VVVVTNVGKDHTDGGATGGGGSRREGRHRQARQPPGAGRARSCHAAAVHRRGPATWVRTRLRRGDRQATLGGTWSTCARPKACWRRSSCRCTAPTSREPAVAVAAVEAFFGRPLDPEVVAEALASAPARPVRGAAPGAAAGARRRPQPRRRLGRGGHAGRGVRRGGHPSLGAGVLTGTWAMLTSLGVVPAPASGRATTPWPPDAAPSRCRRATVGALGPPRSRHTMVGVEVAPTWATPAAAERAWLAAWSGGPGRTSVVTGAALHGRRRPHRPACRLGTAAGVSRRRRPWAGRCWPARGHGPAIRLTHGPRAWVGGTHCLGIRRARRHWRLTTAWTGRDLPSPRRTGPS